METRPITLSEIKSLPQAIAVIEELLASLVQFEERIAALEAENKRLKDQLKLDSHNSSLPPSADKGRQRKSTTSLRKKSCDRCMDQPSSLTGFRGDDPVKSGAHF